jgi:hypothetical protein
MPWIGKITKYHLAKNYGVDCASPDAICHQTRAIWSDEGVSATRTSRHPIRLPLKSNGYVDVRLDSLFDVHEQTLNTQNISHAHPSVEGTYTTQALTVGDLSAG